MSKKASARKSKASSEVASFDQKQMEEFKDVFTFMDMNSDGFIDKNDLRAVYMELGSMASDSTIDEMLADAKGSLNFSTFLHMFGSRMTGTDPENTVTAAISLFDSHGTGSISDEEFRTILKHPRGKPLTDAEVDAVYQGELPISKGKLDLNKFANLICGSDKDPLAQ